MFKPRKAARPYTDPFESRFRRVHMPLRKRFGMTVREVAELLSEIFVDKAIPVAEAQIYKKFAANNVTKKELTEWLGLKNESSTGVFLQDIENRIIGRALGLGILTEESQTPAAKAAEAKTKLHQDYFHFLEEETDRLGEREQRMEHARPNAGMGLPQPEN
jgi:hypothetical protein